VILKIKTLFEDKNILAIDKPSGISVQNDEKSTEKTILDLLPKKYSKIILAHRLDKETSGVLLLAKNEKVYEFLKNQFKNREIKKIYYAIVNGWLKNDHGIINKPIGRSPNDFRRHLAGRGARGELREAITEYKVLKRFNCPSLDPSQREGKKSLSPSLRGGLGGANKFSYLEVKPKTGRTHQIRVHMKFLNYPVACDPLYNPKGFCPKAINRLALHAKSIEFKNLNNKIIKIESPLPKEFKKILK
jgi:23S rRNA pseudouridine1911/1915/1917 synthase